MAKIRRILAVVSTAVMVFSVGCREKSNSTENNVVYYDSSNEYSQDIEGVENEEGDVVKEEELIENIPTIPCRLNDVAEVSGVGVKMLNVYDVGILKANDFYNYDRQVIAVVCEITNNTDAPINVNSFDMNIEYLDGDKTNVTTGTQSMLVAQEKITDMEQFNSEVQPGQTVKGYVSYAVYSRWESLSLYYTPSFAGNNTAVVLDVTSDMVETK